jgi:hypothetical protein
MALKFIRSRMSLETRDVGAATAAGNKPPGRDCIVFLPAIGGGAMIDQTVDGLAYRLASALDINADDKTAVFSSKVRTVEATSTYTGEVGTIYRKDERGTYPVIDIYKFDYRGTLIERYENRNLFVKALLLLLALPGSFWRVFRAMARGRSSKTRAEKLQLLYALGILCLLVVYVCILFGAIWATVQDSERVSSDLGKVGRGVRETAKSTYAWLTPGGRKSGAATPTPTPAPNTPATQTPPGQNAGATTPPAGSNWSLLLRLSQAIVVLWAAVGLFLPPKFNLKDTISKAAVDYLCLIYYLKLGERRRTITGRLEALVDDISRNSENEQKKGTGNDYQGIHLFAYSFGSIVALDTMFPAGKEPGRPLREIDTLVTIGCPFDFVRTLWPSYFDARREYEKEGRLKWINVYSPLDVLGSNFRDDPKTLEANRNVRSEKTTADSQVPAPENVAFIEGLDFSELSLMSSLTLIGLRVHSIYWGVKKEPEVNCFNHLVRKLYDRHAILG